jgi:hypothetical protein
LVDVSESALKSIALVAVFASQFSCERGALFQESSDSLPAEHVLLEEAVDDGQEEVFADVLPLSVAQRFSRLIAVGDAVRAGVVGDALAFLPVHAERVVAGGAVHDPAQLGEAALRASPSRAFASATLVQFGCRALEAVVGNDRFVPVLRLDPLFLGPADDWSFSEFRLAEVEPVPVEAAGVDGVLEDRSDGRLRPLAGGVAPAIDVSWWRWTARAVEVVGDLFEAPAGEVAVEDLSDHVRLVRVWNQS